MFPSTGLYNVQFWDGNDEGGERLRDGIWLVVCKNGKRWPLRFYSDEKKKWIHKYDHALEPVTRAVYKERLEGEGEEPTRGFFRVITFMSVLYVHSATPADAEEEGLALEYESRTI